MVLPSLEIPRPTVRRTVLLNGLRVCTVQLPWLMRTELQMSIKAGSFEDPIGQEGVAHALEHMVFKGPVGENAQGFASRLEAVGGCMNAHTSFEETVYEVTIPSDELDRGMLTLRDLVFHAELRDGDWERERSVILEEMAMRADDPGSRLFDVGLARLWSDGPMSRGVIGTVDSITQLSCENIRAFHATYYTPGAMTLGVASPYSHELIMEVLLAKGFDRPGATPPFVDRSALTLGSGRRVHINHAAQQHQVMLVGDGLRHATAATHAHRLHLLRTHLGGGMSARLFQELRERRGLCYNVGLLMDQGERAGLIGIGGATSPEKVEEFITAAQGEWNRVREISMTQEDLDSARLQVRGQTMLMAMSGSTHLAIALGAWKRNTEDRFDTIADVLDTMNRIQLSDVEETVRMIWLDSPLHVVTLGPAMSA